MIVRCTLSALHAGLRSGEIWVEGSRRYANPATYLITPEDWPAQRAEVLQLTGMPATFAERLAAVDAEMERLLDDLEALLGDPDGPVSVDADDQLHLKALSAEVVDPVALAQRDAVLARLPMVPLTELLIEVDRETGFSAHLTHAGATSPRHSEMEHRRILYAAILSLACNFGSTRMAELTNISADTIDWTVQWCLPEETLRAGNAAIVSAHHRHPLAAAVGGGTLSSSDGLRMPMRGRSLTGRALSRYFVHEGLTSYPHISEQHPTYGTQIIVSTERDATFTLDEILGDTTELPIAEHATDSHGQSLATFALFDLVGLRLSPRIAKLADKRLWRPHAASHYARWPRAGPLLRHHAQVDLIDEHWDDLVRIGGSLKLGHVSAALLIGKLQAGSRLHPLAKAMLEYGKLLRTLHALRWFSDAAFRRRMGRQLNRGEATNDLRRFLFFANRGGCSPPTTTTRPPRPSPTPWWSTPASCPPPATWRTPSPPARPRARWSATRPRRTSASPTSSPSTPTGPWCSTSPASSGAPVARSRSRPYPEEPPDDLRAHHRRPGPDGRGSVHPGHADPSRHGRGHGRGWDELCGDPRRLPRP